MNKKNCSICNKSYFNSFCSPYSIINSQLSHFISVEYPNFNESSFICNDDLHRLRILQIQKTMESDLGEISNLENEVLNSLKEHEIITENIDTLNTPTSGFANSMADNLANFGGSWTFILIFLLILVLWIGINSLNVIGFSFDPYPFIFLNLILSCVAALQAPVIMMSQNRQESKDRVRAEHDYKINLKAELEIRHIKLKIDQIASHQWRRFAEIEETLAEVINLIGKK